MSNRLVPLVVLSSVVLSLLFLMSCTDKDGIKEKASSQLIDQVNLRKAQIENPTSERLDAMRKMGMRVDNLPVQRVFIYLRQNLTAAQAGELKSIGVIVYPDSWLPPVGAHPTGFLLAEMPVDKLDALASKDYVVRLDTAERLAEPQDGGYPQEE